MLHIRMLWFGDDMCALCLQVTSWARQQGERIQTMIQSLATEREEVARLMDWITAAEEALSLRDQEPLTEEMAALEEVIAQHSVGSLGVGTHVPLAHQETYPKINGWCPFPASVSYNT